jgi:hypothetical protein
MEDEGSGEFNLEDDASPGFHQRNATLPQLNGMTTT